MTGIAKADGMNLGLLESGEEKMLQIVAQEITMLDKEEKLLKNYYAMPKNLRDSFSISFKETSKKQ